MIILGHRKILGPPEYSTPVEYSICVTTVPKNSSFSRENLRFLEIFHKAGSEWVWEAQNVFGSHLEHFWKNSKKISALEVNFGYHRKPFLTLPCCKWLKMMKSGQKEPKSVNFGYLPWSGLWMRLEGPKYSWGGVWNIFWALWDHRVSQKL